MAFATPLPDARSVAGWIDGSDRPSCREAARAPPHCSLSPDLPGRENPAQILVGLVPQWPDVICPYGRLRCACTFCVVSEQSNFRSLALPQYSPCIKHGGYFSPLRGGSKRFWGSLFVSRTIAQRLLLMPRSKQEKAERIHFFLCKKRPRKK